MDSSKLMKEVQRTRGFLHQEYLPHHPSQARVAGNDGEIGWVNDAVVDCSAAADGVSDIADDEGEKAEEVFYKPLCQLKTKSSAWWLEWGRHRRHIQT